MGYLVMTRTDLHPYEPRSEHTDLQAAIDDYKDATCDPKLRHPGTDCIDVIIMHQGRVIHYWSSCESRRGHEHAFL
jgi:hypothetical protein